MWQTIKDSLKKYNQWYDSLADPQRFWPLVGLTIVGLFLVNSNIVIISLLGWAYFGFFIVMRWMHLNDKL